MNKVINWVFGSFFRTLGRILVYIVLGLLLSYLLKDVKIPKIDLFQVLDVQALNENGYNLYTFDENDYTELPYDYVLTNGQFYSSTGYNSFNKLSIYNCTNSSSCSSSVTTYHTTGGNVFNHTMVNYGFDFAHDTNITFGSKHLISYQYAVCFEDGISNFSNIIYVNTGVGSSRNNPVTLLSSDYYSVRNINWIDYLSGFVSNNCYITYNLFVAPSSNSHTIKVNVVTSQYSQKYVNLVGYKIEDLGATDYLTESQLNSAISNSGLASASSVNQVQQSVNQVQSEISNTNQSIQNQTQQQHADSQAQIDNANQNTQDIINNQNANNQSQIDNANANTDKTIESQQVCEHIDKDKIFTSGYLLSNGSVRDSNNWGITDYIKINENTKIKVLIDFTAATGAYLVFYDINKNVINSIVVSDLIANQNITIPTNSNYVRFSIDKNRNKPTFEICKNGNQATADKLDDMNSYLTDDSAPNSDISSLGTVQGLLPPGPVDSLLNIPVSFLSVITSSMSGTCTPLQGDFVYGSTLSIPCFGEMIYDNNSIPPVLMLFINVIPSAFILIEYFKHLYKKVDRAVSMDATADDDWGVI